MIVLTEIQQNPRLSYADAYKNAKETVSKLSAGEKAAAEAATINKATEAAEKAKRLKLPKGKSGQHKPPESTGNLRDDVRAAAVQAGVKFS